MILHIFITHQKNLEKTVERLSSMMQKDYIIVTGGCMHDMYIQESRVMFLNCNDTYSGLPEKIIKCFHFILSDNRFAKYTHFCKLDDDMIKLKDLDYYEYDYAGNVYSYEGYRKWHFGKCGNFWDNLEYQGKFVPWCLGGFGYIVSRLALSCILPTFTYTDHIYEDVHLGLLFNNKRIYPTQFKIQDYFISPDHN